MAQKQPAQDWCVYEADGKVVSYFTNLWSIVTNADLSAALADINRNLKTLMSALSEFATKQKAFNGRLSTALDGLAMDIGALNKKIDALQNSAGEVTAEDQALIDDLATQGEDLAAKFEALNLQTPPAPPQE